MKKLFVTMLALGAIATTSQAQTKLEAAPQVKTVSKEEKEAMKAKSEAELAEAFKQAGLTEDEQKKFKEITAEANAKNKATKADAKLSEEQKQAAIKETTDSKNTKLKDALGAKFKPFMQIRKSQKEAASQVAPAKQ